MTNADKDVFDYGFELLEKRYPKETLHDDIKALYLQHFMENLTPSEFIESVKNAVLNSRFMPTAGDLVEYINGGKEVKALQEWRIIVGAAAKANPDAEIAYLSGRARVALQAIGGLRAIALAEDYQRQRMEKQFVTAYCQCSSKDSKSLPQASPVTTQETVSAPPEPSPMPSHVRQDFEALKAKIAAANVNGNGKGVKA